MRRFFSVLLAGILIGLVACAGGTSQLDPSQTTDVINPAAQSGAFNLPAPSTLPHSATAIGQTEIAGGAYLASPLNLTWGDGTVAQYSPDWADISSKHYNPAYAVYSVIIQPVDHLVRLELDWEDTPQSGWIGISEFNNDCWHWYESYSGIDLPEDLDDDYVNDDHELFITVLLTGHGDFVLNHLNLVEWDTPALSNIFFLHHDVGEGIVVGGNIRGRINVYNDANDTEFTFWDHGYKADGLRGPDGEYLDPYVHYGEMTNNTDPEDLFNLWTSADPEWVWTRNLIMENHEVIAFKSSFTASEITDGDMLAQYQTWHLGMRDFFDQHPEKLFVVITPPPLHPDETEHPSPIFARAFADWLTGNAYLQGHPNVVCFDLFDVLASGSTMPFPNVLLPGFRQTGDPNSMPNEAGCQAAAMAMAQFLCDAAVAYAGD
ncbi:hypothetical protein JW859_12460 [bacterium]|nr:hypothetical protein [bacterium]